MQAADWAREEVGRAEVGDVRRTRRLEVLGTLMAERSSRSQSEICEEWAGQKAGYRFLAHEAVRPASILASHRRATEERMSRERVALAVQDTTTQHYSDHPATIGLGALKRATDRGLVAHTTLAVTPERAPPGILAQEVWARDPATVGKRARRKARPIAEQESRRWLTSLEAVIDGKAACPPTHRVSVGDREADVYDLFVVERPVGVALLIRAAWDRGVDGPPSHRWATVAPAPQLGTRTVEVPRRPGQLARTAEVALQAQPVTLRPPRARTGDGLPPVTITAPRVIETAPPSTRQAVRWIAQLGGFPARASDGDPGPTTLRRGFLHLADLTSMFCLLTHHRPNRG